MTFFLFFKSMFPDELRNMGPFYHTVIDAPLTDVWYKNQTTGANTINTTLKRMKNVTPLAELCANKKITNHSEGETAVQKLSFFGFPKNVK